MTLCVGILAWPWELALSRKRASEQVRLALRTQDPDTVVGLESWNAANLSLLFHDFFRLLPPQLGLAHFLSGPNDVVILRCEPCTACERCIHLQRCSLCSPLGVRKGHGAIIQPWV